MPAEARQQCEGYAGRLAEAERQLKRAEFERAQWEWRAQDAEGKAQAGSEAAEAAHAGALRAAERRAGQAEARAAEQESQAKAAALQVLVSGCGVGVRGGSGWEGGSFTAALPVVAPALAHHLHTRIGRPCCAETEACLGWASRARRPTSLPSHVLFLVELAACGT